MSAEVKIFLNLQSIPQAARSLHLEAIDLVYMALVSTYPHLSLVPHILN